MKNFELVKFSLLPMGVSCTYRTEEEYDGIPFQQEFSVNDTRAAHEDLLTAAADLSNFLTNYFGTTTAFLELKFSGSGERRAVVVKGKMKTALGDARVTLPKVRVVTDDREQAVDLYTCCERLQEEVGLYLFEGKTGDLAPIEDL